MDWGLFVGVSSFLLGIPALVLAYRSYRKQLNPKLFFFEKENLKLYDDIIKNIPDLEITFKGEKVLTNMFILKGIFICSGHKAVNLTEHDDGIIMSIKEDGAMWHTFDVTKKSDHLTINHSISGPDLTIKFKQLKDKQHFVIECLGQANQPSLTFNNMIGNVEGIIQENIEVGKGSKTNLISWIGIWLMILIFMVHTFSRLTDDFRLKPTYYNKANQIVPSDSVKKTFQRSYRVPAGSIYQDSVLYDSPVTYNFHFEKDSIDKLAKKENRSFNLLFGGKTDTLRVNSNFYAIYSINYGWSDLIVIIPIYMFIVVL